MARTLEEVYWNRVYASVEAAERIHKCRQRRLLGSASTPLGIKLRFNPQPQSVLLNRLPMEVRIMIWETLIAGMILRLFAVNRNNLRTGGPPCPDCVEGEGHSNAELTYRDLRKEYGLETEHGCESGPVWSRNLGIVSLLKTCRQVYCEAIRVLYQKNVFRFLEIEMVQLFRASISVECWALIQSIRIRWRPNPRTQRRMEAFEGSCAAVKSLQGLRQFVLIVPYHRGGNEPSVEQLMEQLVPLKELRIERRWELIINFSQSKVEDMSTALESAGFNCLVTRYEPIRNP